MRLGSLLAVPLVTAGVSFAGLYVAPAAGAECQSRNGTMLCTDPPAPSRSSDSSTEIYPCEFDWYCDDYGLDIVLGNDNDRPNANPPRPNNDLPRPGRPNRPRR